MVAELIRLGQLDDFSSPLGANTDFWSLLDTRVRNDPAAAALLMGAYLKRGFVRASEVHANDPFESGHLSEESGSVSVILDTAKSAPAEFVEYVLPFVARLAMANQSPAEREMPIGRRWGIGYKSSAYAVFTALCVALETLGVDNPEKCTNAIESLRAAESYELRLLACRALAAMDDPDDAVGWLISDHRNLTLGYIDRSQWASRELIEKHSPCCSPELFDRLEAVILSHTHGWDKRPWRGYRRYELLSAVDESRMSEHARRKLGELRRRFPNATLEPPKQPKARTVRSPIGDDASKRMSDSQWIQALKKHTSPEPVWHGDGSVGGAGQLAGQSLGPRAKDDPERFARLALRFTDTIPATAISAIIRNVEGELDADLLADLCEHAHNVYGPQVAASVCDAIARAGEADPRLVALLSVYSHDPDPASERARTKTESSVYAHRGDLLAAGLNSTRGQAARAVASVIFAGDDHPTALLPVLESLATDEILAVRVWAAEGVRALLNHSQDQALDLAERLFNAPIDVLDTQTSELLLLNAVLRDPNRFRSVLAAALAGPAGIATRAGRIWAVARCEDQLPDGIASDFPSLPAAARRGAAEVLADNPAVFVYALPQFFNDTNPEVRQRAAQALLHLNRIAVSDRHRVIDAFIESPAFPDHMYFLFQGLVRTTSRLPANTIQACERMITLSQKDLTDTTIAHSLTGRDLITVVLRLYKQGGKELRGRCLDIIDQLTELDMYGLEQTIRNER